MTVDVKHYEDCKQLFFSVGKCFVIEALLELFQMDNTKHKPTANSPHSVHVFILYFNIGNWNHIGVRICYFSTIVQNKTAKITS